LLKRAGGPNFPGDYVGFGTAAVAAALGIDTSTGKTGTVKENTDQWTANHADGIKYKTVNIKYKPSKLAKLTRALSQTGSIYDYSASGGFSTQGAQGASLVTTIDAALFAELYGVLNTPVTVTTHSRKMYLGLMRTELEFQNAGNTTCEFEIYVLIDKNTGSLSSPGTIWDNGINAEVFNATAPVENKTDLWNKPTSYKAFNIAFWTKRYSCHLTPGENCKFNLNFNPGRILDTQYMDDYSSIRGLTHHVMVVQRGVLGDSTKTKTVTAAGQTLTPSKLIWLIKRTFHGCVLNTLPKVTKQHDGTGELPTLLGALWHQDEDGGPIEDATLDANYA